MPSKDNSGINSEFSLYSNSTLNWIIDLGATNYMIDNLHLLDNETTTSKCPSVTIANDSKAFIEKKGSTKLLSNVISDVFLFANVHF
jgi:hypothetical protein